MMISVEEIELTFPSGHLDLESRLQGDNTSQNFIVTSFTHPAPIRESSRENKTAEKKNDKEKNRPIYFHFVENYAQKLVV